LGCNNNLGSDIFKGELKPKAKESIKLINDLAIISTVRDQRTYELLSNLGITKHQLLLDPGNFLEVPEIAKEKRVAINICQHSPALGRFDGGEEGQKKRYENIINFAKIGMYLQNKGYKIIFIAHDALEQSLIIDLQKQLPNLEYINTDNIDIILKEYARCEFSICMKMHANIMSFAAGTPSIALYYDIKTIEYQKLIKLSELGCSVFANYNEWLYQIVNKLIDNNKNYIAYIKSIKKINQIEFDKLMDKVCNIIKTTI